MFKRQPLEGSSHPRALLLLLPSLLLLTPPSSLAANTPPALLSLLLPWAEEPAGAGEMGQWRQAALEALEETPVLSSGDGRRLQAFLGSDRGDRVPAGAADWESPRDPDLFLLTEVGAKGEGRRRGDAGGVQLDVDEMAASRVKRTGGLSVGGSRIRTSVGGGMLGGGGGRGGFGGLGGGRGMGGPVGGGIAGGPSLSIVNPLDVLRQRLLLEIARRRMRQSEDQILANRELLKSIGKREVEGRSGEATAAPDLGSPTKKPMPM